MAVDTLIHEKDENKKRIKEDLIEREKWLKKIEEEERKECGGCKEACPDCGGPLVEVNKSKEVLH